MELKFDPGFRVIGEYWESHWPSISSQFDSNILPLLGILGQSDSIFSFIDKGLLACKYVELLL